MIGYRDKDGFHVILEHSEVEDLITIVGKGIKAIENLHLSKCERLMGLTASMRKASLKDAKIFNDKLGIIFRTDHYRKGGITKDNPVIARIDHHLSESDIESYAKTH